MLSVKVQLARGCWCVLCGITATFSERFFLVGGKFLDFWLLTLISRHLQLNNPWGFAHLPETVLKCNCCHWPQAQQAVNPPVSRGILTKLHSKVLSCLSCHSPKNCLWFLKLPLFSHGHWTPCQVPDSQDKLNQTISDYIFNDYNNKVFVISADLDCHRRDLFGT